MENLKILCGTTYDNNCGGRPYYEQMKNAYSLVIGQEGKYKVEYFEFAFSKAKLVERLESGEFNVVITDGSLSGTDAAGGPVKEGIGFSSIRNWLNDYPGLKIVLIEDEGAKGKAKIGKLFRELSYYNIVFRPEGFKWAELMRAVASVINKPRTAKEALEEYGISGFEDIKEYLRQNPSILGEESVVLNGVQVEKAVNEPTANMEVTGGVVPGNEAVSQMGVLKNDKVTTTEVTGEASINEPDKETEKVQEHTEEELTEESLEERIGAFASFGFGDTEESGDVAVESMESPKVEPQAETGGFDFSSVFGKEGNIVSEEAVVVTEEFAEEEEIEEAVTSKGFDFSFGAGFAEPEAEVVKETEKRWENTVIAEEVTQTPLMEDGWREASAMDELSGYVPKMDVTGSSALSCMGNRECKAYDSSILPTKGVIKNVVDYDTIMVVFDKDICDGSYLDEYKCIVRVKGNGKGTIVNGRYKSANITFEAYVDCMVNNSTVMLDVFEFDCEEKKAFLEGRECNLIFVKI